MKNGLHSFFQLDGVADVCNLYGLSDIPVPVPGTLAYTYMIVYSIKDPLTLFFRKREYRIEPHCPTLFPTLALTGVARKDGVFYLYFSSTDVNIGGVKQFTIRNPREVDRLVLHMASVYDSRKPTGYFLATADFYRLLAAIAEIPKNYDFLSGDAVGIQYMRSHFFEPDFRITDAADACGVSEATFRRHFLKQMGISPGTYVNELRVEYAYRLLSAGVPLREVATRSGFSDVAYFTEVFTHLRGISPRKMFQKEAETAVKLPGDPAHFQAFVQEVARIMQDDEYRNSLLQKEKPTLKKEKSGTRKSRK